MYISGYFFTVSSPPRVFEQSPFLFHVGTQPVKKCIDYNTSKAAMKMMARIFALEEAPKGVRARASWNGVLVAIVLCISAVVSIILVSRKTEQC